MVAFTLQFSGGWTKVLNLPKELTWGCLVYPDTGSYFSAQFSCLVCDTPSTGKRFFLVLKLLIQFVGGYYFLRNFQKHLKFNGSHNLARESLSAEFFPLPSIYRIWHHLRLEGDSGEKEEEPLSRWKGTYPVTLSVGSCMEVVTETISDYPLDGLSGQPFKFLGGRDHNRVAFHLFDY